MNPPALLFDFWGVIGGHQQEADLEAMADCAGVPLAAFLSAYWEARPDYDRGCGTGDYWSHVGALLGRKLLAEDVAALDALDVASWQRVDPSMVELVAQLHAQGAEVGLLSNAPRGLVTHVEATVGRWMRALVFSCRVGAAKPERAIYEEAVRAMGRPPRELVFIDDREVNIEAAHALGFQVVLHESLEQTRASLNEMLAHG